MRGWTSVRTCGMVLRFSVLWPQIEASFPIRRLLFTNLTSEELTVQGRPSKKIKHRDM